MEVFNFNNMIVAELALEADRTEKLFNALPDTYANWCPHEKSMTMKGLTEHLTVLQTWFSNALKDTNFDIKSYKPEFSYSSFRELGSQVQEHTLEIIAFVKTTDNAFWQEEFTLTFGDHIIMKSPRWVVYRQMLSNHMIHHRGQLTTYLRLLNISVPGLFGPSADEK